MRSLASACVALPVAINGIHASFDFGSIVRMAEPTARASPPPKMMAALTAEESTSVDRLPSMYEKKMPWKTIIK